VGKDTAGIVKTLPNVSTAAAAVAAIALQAANKEFQSTLKQNLRELCSLQGYKETHARKPYKRFKGSSIWMGGLTSVYKKEKQYGLTAFKFTMQVT